jgi:hypothetical protein
VVSRFGGVLVADDILAFRREFTAHPDFVSGMDELTDLTRVEHVEIDATTLRRLASTTPFREGSRVAIVAPTDLLFGIARLFEMSGESSGWDARVFRSMDEARTWLGLDES